MIPCASKHLKRLKHRSLKTFRSQIETEGSLKIEKAIYYEFWLKALRDSKVMAAKVKSSEVGIFLAESSITISF